MALENTSTGELVTAAWLNAIVDRINAMLVSATGGIWTGTVQKVMSSFRGLHLRTHPNAGAALTQVAVLNLDEVVMSDGGRYLPPKSIFPLAADVTLSGPSGLDTGTETSGWYEVYLIGKSSTNASSDLRLILHLAKVASMNQWQHLGPLDSPLRFGATTNIKIAQSVQTSIPGAVNFIDLNIFRVGAPTGTIWLTLEASSGGNPSGTPLATSDKMDATKFHTANQWIRFPFRKPATVTPATQYFIVLQGDYAINGTSYVSWTFQGTNVYANGHTFFFNGSAWGNTVTQDQTFQLFVTTGDTPVTMPTGFDQSIKLGYVLNNDLSDFVPFVAFDRQVRRLTGGGTGTAGSNWGANSSQIPSLKHLSALIPLAPIILKNMGQGSVPGLSALIGGVPDGFGLPSVYGDWGTAQVAIPTANYPFDMPDIFTSDQGAYSSISGGAGSIDVFLLGWTWLS